MPSTPGLRRRIVTLVVLLALAGTVMLAVPGLRDVLAQIADMRLGWIAGALVLELASCVGYVVVFRLFFDRLPAARAREVAWSVMGSGALLPGGGVGGLAIGGWLLRLGGMPLASIVRRASGVFWLTSAVSGAILVVVGLLVLAGAAAGPDDVLLAGVPVAVALLALATILALPALARRFAPGGRGRDLLAGIELARAAVARPSWRLAGAAAYVLCDIAVLWMTFAALGLYAPPAALALGYLVGYLANALPVPGGVGALDAGLIGALVLYGLPAEATAAAVLVYHAIVFWLPGAGGAIAYLRVKRRLAPRGEPVVVGVGGAPALAA